MKPLLLGILLAAFGMACHAELPRPDPTGLWMDPAESGWGMSVAQQGDTAFVALYVYDDAHRPAWYVASDALGTPTIGLFPVTRTFHGTLYRTSGPWFGGAFDPGAVGIAEVGTIEFTYVLNAPATLSLVYTIDGQRVVKTIVPQSWGENRSLLVGHYVGARPSLTASSPGCDPGNVDIVPPPGAPFSFSVTAGPPPEIHVLWNRGSEVCVIVGAYAQRGQLGSVTGVVGCVPPVDPAAAAPAELSELAIGPHGFTGVATFHKGSCTYTTNFGGVRQP